MAGHGWQCSGNGGEEFGAGAGLGAAQKLFHLAPHFLDGIQIRRIRRQKANRRARLFNQPKGQVVLVRREVVHDDQVVGT